MLRLHFEQGKGYPDFATLRFLRHLADGLPE